MFILLKDNIKILIKVSTAFSYEEPDWQYIDVV